MTSMGDIRQVAAARPGRMVRCFVPAFARGRRETRSCLGCLPPPIPPGRGAPCEWGDSGTPSGVTDQSPPVVKWTLSEVTAERERLSDARQPGRWALPSFWQTLHGARQALIGTA